MLLYDSRKCIVWSLISRDGICLLLGLGFSKLAHTVIIVFRYFILSLKGGHELLTRGCTVCVCRLACGHGSRLPLEESLQNDVFGKKIM